MASHMRLEKLTFLRETVVTIVSARKMDHHGVQMFLVLQVSSLSQITLVNQLKRFKKTFAETVGNTSEHVCFNG